MIFLKKTILSGALCVMVMSPIYVSAQSETLSAETRSYYLNIINSILEQLKSMQERFSQVTDDVSADQADATTDITTVVPVDLPVTSNAQDTVSSTPFTFAFNLNEGMQGRDVIMLQRVFTMIPDIYPSGLVTGYFGTLTREGVENYQTLRGITRDESGKVQDYTRAALNKDVLNYPGIDNNLPSIDAAGNPFTSTYPISKWAEEHPNGTVEDDATVTTSDGFDAAGNPTGGTTADSNDDTPIMYDATTPLSHDAGDACEGGVVGAICTFIDPAGVLRAGHCGTSAGALACEPE